MKKNTILFAIVLTAGFALGQNVTDAKGLKQGYWKKPSGEAGKIIFEGLFKDNKPQGIFKYYYPFDTVKAIIDFKKDGAYSYAKLFHPTGKIMAKGKYVGESIKDSVWLYYDDLGVMMSKETYTNGKKNGKALVYFPNGKLAEEKNFKSDVLHGNMKQYYDGTKVKSEANYIEGKQEGKSVFYFPNGIAAATGFYKNGLKNGPWIYKNQEGKVTEKELYEYGILADKKKSDEFFSKNKTKDETPVKSKEQKSAGNKPAPKKG